MRRMSNGGGGIPFFVGAVMAFALAAYYQRSVDESEMWRKTTHTKSPIKVLFQGENLRNFLQVFTLMTGFWLSLNASLCCVTRLAYFANARDRHKPDFCAGRRLCCAWRRYVLGGALSQRIGRRTYIMSASAVSAVFGTFCYYRLLNTERGNMPVILLLATLVVVFVVAPGATGTVYITERFQTGVRATGFGLSYGLAMILPAFYVFYQAGLANFMPFKYTVLVLVVVGAAFIFVGAAWGPETKDVDFESMSASDGSR